MSRSGYRRAKDLYLRAIELPADERAALLDRECDGEPELRHTVEQLLGYETDPRSPLEVVGATVEWLASRDLPATIGGYKVLGVLGEGAMGRVFEAEQQSPRRRVAIKVLRSGRWSEAARERFRREAELLGRLRHPNIAQVYEAHTDDDAENAFIVMEKVEGVRLSELARRTKSMVSCLELWATLCDAVQHAHSQGVIHRDLKPANILVDSEGRARILDFGIARRVGDDTTGDSRPTVAGEVMGTLAYMSPEQALGDPEQIDARTDVYALGVLGYEMVTGQLPRDLRGQSVAESLVAIRDRPIRPPRDADSSLPADLARILTTALAVDKRVRYQTAEALSADIRRFLRREPIAAHPPSSWYQTRMFARRHRGLIVGVAAVLVALAIGLVATGVYATELEHTAQSLREANRREREATEQQRALTDEARRATYAVQMRAIGAALDAGRREEVRRLLEETDPAMRGWEWRHFSARLDTASLVIGDEERSPRARGVAFAADGGGVWTATRAGELECWAMDGSRQWACELGRSVASFSANAAGDRLATVTASGALAVWRMEVVGEAARATLLAHAELDLADSADVSVRISPRGDRILVRADRSVWLWSADDAEPEALGVSSRYTGWSPNGYEFAAGRGRLIDARTASEAARLPTASNAITAAAFDATGSRLALGTRNPRVEVFDVRTGARLYEFPGYRSGIAAMAWGLEGRVLFAAETAGDVHAWDVGTGRRIRSFGGHRAAVEELVVSADGRHIAAAAGGVVSVWRTDEAGDVQTEAAHGAVIHGVAWSPDGDLLATADRDGTVRLWDGWSAAPVGVLARGLRGGPRGIGWAVGGEYLVLHIPDAVALQLFEGARLEGVGTPADGVVWPGRLAFGRSVSPSGELTLRAERRRGAPVELRRGRGAKPITMHAGDDAFLFGSAFSPDERTVALAWESGEVTLHDTISLARVATLAGHAGAAHSVAFSADGERLATGGSDRTVRLWDPATGTCTGVLRGHESDVQTLSFSDDGTRLASGSHDGTFRLWSTLPRREAVARAARAAERRGAEHAADEVLLARWREEADVDARRILIERTLARAGDGGPADVLRLEGAEGSAFGAALALRRGRGEVPGALFVGAPGSSRNEPGSLHRFSWPGREAHGVVRGREPGERFGAAVAIVRDRDGDGVDDLAVGSPGADGAAGLDAGAIVILSGATLARLERWEGERGGAGLGAFVAEGADYDGDERPDLVVSGPVGGAGTSAVAAVLSSASGRMIRAWELEAPGLPPASPACDVDGDGVEDLVLVGGRDGVRVVSVVTGEVLQVLAEGRRASVVVDRDRDGDGVPELWIGHQGAREGRSRTSTKEDRVELRFSTGGREGWRTSVPVTRVTHGPRLRRVEDLTGDGVDEVVVWSSHHSRGRPQRAPALTVLDGATGIALGSVPTGNDAQPATGSASWVGAVGGRWVAVVGAPDQRPPAVEIQTVQTHPR